jgi:sugar transferase EpsL
MKIKRIVDVVVSLLLLATLSPVILLTALAVLLALGRPVVFAQRRPGFHGEVFTLYKFRTMTDRRDSEGVLLPDGERLTSVGRLLRALSMDELPELVNVLKGDMSLVGPRPLLEEYLDRYSPDQARRHDMKPGITGLAQVNGRQAIPFSKRIEWDICYVDQWSLALDLRILASTVPAVLGLRGVLFGQEIDDIDDLGLDPISSIGRRRNGSFDPGAPGSDNDRPRPPGTSGRMDCAQRVDTRY